jgi:(R,R)-butanediol dehydrogenase/meso-butanediol dehydrogenase/diacetyl reductase
MKAIIYSGPETPLSLQERQVPQAGAGQLLLKVHACGICGSDLHAYQAAASPAGTVFGHEFAGEVVGIGEGVEGDWQIGDRAVSLGAIFCGYCAACCSGKYPECENMELIGFTRDGAYAEYVVAQAAGSIRLPANISYDQAALVEPLAVGLAAFRDSQLPLGGNVLVMGAGVIGITAAKWARFFGAGHVAISDLDADRLVRAKQAGATLTIDAAAQADTVEAFRQANGCNPDVIIECVGRPLLQQLVDIAPRGAHIIAVGATMEQEPILSVAAAQKRIRMTFSFGYTLEDFEFIVRMIAAGRIQTDGLITQSVPLEEVPESFAALMEPNSHCKVMIEPSHAHAV